MITKKEFFINKKYTTSNKWIYLLFGVFITFIFFETRLKIPYQILKGRSKAYSKAIYSKLNSKDLKDCDIPTLKDIPSNSSLVIGHAYGKSNKQKSISNKVIKLLDNKKNNINRVIFTGDVFQEPSIHKWNYLNERYKDYFEIFIAPGNHDVGDSKDNTKRDVFKLSPFYKNDFPYAIFRDKKRFIIEDSTLLNWRISEKAIELLNKKDDNLIILLRHNIPVKELLSLSNSLKYSTDLHHVNQLSKIISNKIIIISGDSGAYGHTPGFKCNTFKNIKFLTNGIGDRTRDQIMIIKKEKIYKYKI